MKILKVIGYWLVQITWGAPTFIMGLFVALFMLITGHKPHRFGYTFYFTPSFMHNCGFEIGPIFCIAEDCSTSLHMKQHEHGHGIQTLIFGPVMFFVISIPSMVRFWYREFDAKKMAKKLANDEVTSDEYKEWSKNRPSYDSIWFEGWATSLGEKFFPEDLWS